MRNINYICRFPVAVIVTIVLSIVAYVATAFAMVCIDWDREYASIKTVHTDMEDLFLIVLGMKK